MMKMLLQTPHTVDCVVLLHLQNTVKSLSTNRGSPAIDARSDYLMQVNTNYTHSHQQ